MTSLFMLLNRRLFPMKSSRKRLTTWLEKKAYLLVIAWALSKGFCTSFSHNLVCGTHFQLSHNCVKIIQRSHLRTYHKVVSTNTSRTSNAEQKCIKIFDIFILISYNVCTTQLACCLAHLFRFPAKTWFVSQTDSFWMHVYLLVFSSAV